MVVVVVLVLVVLKEAAEGIGASRGLLGEVSFVLSFPVNQPFRSELRVKRCRKE